MPGLPYFSKERLLDLAKLCAGLSLLVFVAVFLHTLTGSGNNAAAVATFGSSVLTLNANPTSVSQNGTTTLTWSATNITDIPGDIFCFGDGDTCLTTDQSISNASAQLAYFTSGGSTYVVSTDHRTSSANVRVYKLQDSGTGCPTAGGLGDGTTCGSTVDTLSLTGYAVNTFTSGSAVYVLIGVGNSSSNSLRVYAWMPSGNGGLGCLGDGTTCDSVAYQVSGASRVQAIQSFTYGGATYVVDGESNSSNALDVYKWMPPPSNSGKGCLGDGTTCGTAIHTINLNNVLALKPITIGSNVYLASGLNATSNSLRIYKWIPTANSGKGCFGDTTTCGNQLQTQINVNKAAALVSFEQGGNTFLVEGTTDYSVQYPSPGLGGRMYIWMPSANSGNGCFGDGASTCGSPYQNLAIGGSWAMEIVPGGNEGPRLISHYYYYSGWPSYIEEATIEGFKWQESGTNCPSSGGFGDGTTCGNHDIYNSNDYFFDEYVNAGGLLYVPDSTLPRFVISYGGGSPSFSGASMKVFRAMFPACFGDGTTCDTPLQNLSAASASSNTPADWQEVTVPGSTDQYIFVAAQNSSTSHLYKWISAQDCFGNGSACGSSYQDITTSNASAAAIATTSTNTYLFVANGTGSASYMYKWQSSGTGCPSGGGFGNGATCGTAYQSFPTSNPTAWHTFTVGSTLYAAVANGTGSYTNLYKWQSSGTGCPSGGGFGNGSACVTSSGAITSNALQSFSTTNGATDIDTAVVSGTTYLVIAQSGNSPSTMYKWQSSGTGCPSGGGFGNGTACGSVYQTMATEGHYPRDIEIFTVGSDPNPFLAFAEYNTSALLKWTASAGYGCPSSGGFGNGLSGAYAACDDVVQFFSMNVGEKWTFVPNADSTEFYLIGSDSGGSPAAIYKWLPNLECFGWNDTSYYWGYDTCSYPVGYIGDTSYLSDIEAFTVSGQPYIIAGNTHGPYSYLYTLAESTEISTTPACRVTWTNGSSETGTVAVANSGSQASPPISEDTTYTLACQDVGSVDLLVQVQNNPTVTISATQNAAEPSTNGSFTVTRSTVTASALTVNYTVTGGAATAGTDYTTLSGSVSIPANQASAAVTIAPIDDLAWEGSETVIIGLSTNVNYTLGTPNTATVTITDNETTSSLPAGTFDSCVGTASVSCELAATPERVREGNSVTLTWYVGGLITGENSHTGTTCTIVRVPDNGSFPITSTSGATSWVDVSGVTDPITQQTIFTLSCTAEDGTSKSVSRTVQLVPTYHET